MPSAEWRDARQKRNLQTQGYDMNPAHNPLQQPCSRHIKTCTCNLATCNLAGNTCSHAPEKPGFALCNSFSCLMADLPTHPALDSASCSIGRDHVKRRGHRGPASTACWECRETARAGVAGHAHLHAAVVERIVYKLAPRLCEVEVQLEALYIAPEALALGGGLWRDQVAVAPCN